MRRGFAMLVVLLAVAIIAVLYFVDVRAVFQVREPVDPGAQWLAGGRIIEKGRIPLPQPPQPSLEQFAGKSAPIRQYGDERGTLEVRVAEDGKVSGVWNATYFVGDIEYTVQATAEGNVDAERVYEGEGGRDPSRLLIVGKGTFTRKGYNSRISRSDDSQGRAYLNGWLTPDGHGEGEFFLVHSSNSYEAFQWTF